MQQLGNNLWIADGESVPFFTLPYSTRMVVVRLSSGDLWVHSPIQLTDELQQQVDELGKVCYLIAPNQLHHLYLQAWQSAYPQARSYGTAGVRKKRRDLHFDGELTNSGDTPWSQDIDQELVTGSVVMEECVFFHKDTRTLILTDLIENFAPQSFTPLKRLVARVSGILAPNGKTPIDWRLSFMFGTAKARAHLERVLDWRPKSVVMAHGLIVTEDADDFLRRSFNWLKIK